MIFDIYENGRKINSIIADTDFIAEYCRENGYTYTSQDENKPLELPALKYPLVPISEVKRYGL